MGNASEAREAMTAMNGFQLAGEELKAQGPDHQPGMLKDASDRLALMQKLQGPGAAPAFPGGPIGGMAGMPGARPPMSYAPMGGGMQAGPMGMATGMVPGQQLNMPSTIIVLHGMFNPSQVNLQTDPEFFNDIHADVEQECRKYGAVVKVWADRASSRGDVWVRFADITSSANCQRALDRRWFAGQQIIAEFK